MKIQIKLGQVSKSLKQVEEYQKKLEMKQRLFLQRLAELGSNEAETRFSIAQYDGTNDVIVEEPIWDGDNRIIVQASGSSILFIEFGTGVVYTNNPHPKADEFGYERGGYGQHRGRHTWWLYRGEPGTNGKPSKLLNGLVYTSGNSANRCMWEASKEMRAKLLEIAKEVFK